MLDFVKQLFENNVISEETKSEIESAWETAVQENRDTISTQLREEFAQKYEHDKTAMVEAVYFDIDFNLFIVELPFTQFFPKNLPCTAVVSLNWLIMAWRWQQNVENSLLSTVFGLMTHVEHPSLALIFDGNTD